MQPPRRRHSRLKCSTTPKCFNICQWNPTWGWHRSAGAFRWHLTTAPGGPDMPFWRKRDVSAQNTSVTRGGTSRGTPAPGSGCQSSTPTPPYLEGSSKQSLLKTCRYLQGSPRFNLWFTTQSALEDPRTHHQTKREEMNEASFIASSLSIKARPYQRPLALLKMLQTDGQISSDRLIEFWQTAHKKTGDH